MDTRSTHVLVELRDCNPERLNDSDFIETLLRRAAEAAGASVIAVVSHRFEPQGVAAVAVLAESHLSIHTWPEANYAAVDVYTCGDPDPTAAVPVVTDGLGATHQEVVILERGGHGPGPGVRVVRHERP